MLETYPTFTSTLATVFRHADMMWTAAQRRKNKAFGDTSDAPP
ncbi:hypothetical protein BIFDEN_01859 [Bifidobacterium dentium ATCC 27678]|nr:hypothetical protein BIFDEN_01859 [Bifidobacterium dentium ATCC 27678]